MNRQAAVPSSVRFTEVMKGYISFGEDDHGRGAREGRKSDTRLKFRLTIDIVDLDRFAVDDMREARARGWVECEALGGRLPVERGNFNLFVDDHEPYRKRMLYRLYFRDKAGHPLTLAGFKALQGHSVVHVWRDTTTLFVRVVRAHVGEGDEPGAEVVASGILRLRAHDFLRQLATFRAGGSTPVKRAAAIARFDALFLGGLWQVYGRPALRRRWVGTGRRGTR